MLDLTGRTAVIVGGGAVALRKATGLLEAGAATVRCVAPSFHADLPTAVERIAARYELRHLDGAAVVFAATDDPAVNDAVVRDARSRGILVSRADAGEEADAGDFTAPARLARGPVTVAVSAGGAPALAAAIRDGLAERWDPNWTAMADAMQTLRPRILASRDATPAERRAAFRDLATPLAMEVLAGAGPEGLMQWLRARHPRIAHSDEKEVATEAQRHGGGDSV